MAILDFTVFVIYDTHIGRYTALLNFIDSKYIMAQICNYK